jgi:hypothetical protein
MGTKKSLQEYILEATFLCPKLLTMLSIFFISNANFSNQLPIRQVSAAWHKY